MGKTFNTGYLQNIIQYDGSNNIILPSLIGTGTRIVVAAANGTLSSQTASTTNIAEGTNLYYTDTRVGTYLSANTYATQSYVTTAIANLVDASPATLDTLNELAAALGDDPNFATTVATSIGTKQAQLNGTGFVKVSGTTVSYDNSTYLTTSSASSTYVPYTGASADLVLGANNFSSKRVSVLKSSDGFGGFTSNYLFLQTGSSTTNVGTDGISLLSKPNTRALVINYDIGGTNYAATLDAALLTNSRTFEFPNASGILALTSNIPTLSSLGGQTALSGTGFVKISGTTISYDNSTYLTTASATSTYLPLAGGTLTGPLVGTSATFNHNDAPTVRVQRNGGTDSNTVLEFTNASRSFFIGSNGTVMGLGGTSGSVGSQPLQISSTGAATFSNTLQVNGGNITSFSGVGAAGFGNGITIHTQPGTYTAGHGGILQFQNEDVITGGIRAIRDGGSWGGALLFYTHNTTAGNTFGTTFTENMKLSNDGILSVVGDILTGIDKGIKFDSSGSSGHPEISVDSSVNLNFKNSAGTTNLTLSNNGAATFISSITTSGNINVNSDGIFINRSTSGEPYIFFRKDSVNRASIYGVTGGGLRIFDESDNQVLTITGTRLGISDPSPSRKLTVNFGTSVNDGLMVYGSQRLNTVFQSTGEHCFIYMDSFHNNTFLPRLHLQRSSTTYGVVGLERASNSDGIGVYVESEMVVGTTTTVPFSIQTNSQRRIRVASGGGVEVFNTLSVSGNLTARNFSRNIKSWAPPGSTGSGASTTYNWADELAALAGNFDNGGYYKGFIRSGNGAHYYGYHFDILVGSQGYGGNSLQYKVQNVVGANAPWVGGCGFSPFGTVDNTNFTHVNNPCGEYLELFITKLGG